MNNDLISREAASDIIANMEAVAYSPYPTIGRLDALLALRRIPSTERWIPVTEKLPEKDGDYLVTYTDGGVTGVGSSLYIQREDGSEPYWDYFNVIAWMPLPRPYKVSDEE